MGGKSRMIYTDDEKTIRGRLFKEYVEGEGIELYRTRTRGDPHLLRDGTGL